MTGGEFGFDDLGFGFVVVGVSDVDIVVEGADGSFFGDFGGFGIVARFAKFVVNAIVLRVGVV